MITLIFECKPRKSIESRRQLFKRAWKQCQKRVAGCLSIDRCGIIAVDFTSAQTESGIIPLSTRRDLIGGPFGLSTNYMAQLCEDIINPSNDVLHCLITFMLSTYCKNFPTFSLSFVLGNVFGACLYGVLTVQLYRYYMSFPKDRKPFKVVIYIVYVTETIFTVLLVYDLAASIYDSGVVNLDITGGFVPIFCEPRSSVSLILTVSGGTVELLTQSMYAYRIRIITKLKCISWIIIVVLASKLFAIIIINALLGPTLINVVTLVWASVSLVVDVTITSIMVWSLKKDEIYSKKLKNKIAHLIYLIIGTGFLIVATNISVLVLLFRLPSQSIGPSIILSKLYANSMMVLVNSHIPSARSEPTLDIVTVRLSSFHARSEAAADAEHGQRGSSASVDLEARSILGLSAHEAEDTPNNHDLGTLTV